MGLVRLSDASEKAEEKKTMSSQKSVDLSAGATVRWQGAVTLATALGF